jgi:hypothetical protein
MLVGIRKTNLVLYCRIEKAVNGHGNDTLAELAYLDKGKGNWNKRRFLILSTLRLMSSPPVATLQVGILELFYTWSKVYRWPW